MSVKNGIFINTESELRVVIYTILIFYTLVSVPVALKFFAENTKAIENEEDEELQEKMIVRNGVIRILLIGLGLAINVLFYYLLKEQSLIYMAGISAVALFFAKPKRYKN